MSAPVVDTDVIVRLVTGDEPAKQVAAFELFRRVRAGEITLQAPVTVIADAVYVLSSRKLYGLSRKRIVAMLRQLLLLPGFHVADRRTILRALELYEIHPALDFGDGMVVASMEMTGATAVYSYDHHFNRIGSIRRLEPPRAGPNGA
ncbi:MAG: PIN domain-containing protein [Thermomicrobiales bacterium]